MNFDDPAYPFRSAARVFALQEPLVAAADELLSETSWTASPDASRAMKRLIRAYRASRLVWFQAEF